MAKLRFRAKQSTKHRSKKLQALVERDDDRIAPKAAAHSIDALQRWALQTANIRQGSHKPNEAQTVERIHDRYVNEAFSPGSHREVDQKATSARSDRTLQDAASRKNKHTISPIGSLQLSTVYTEDTSDTGVRGEATLGKITTGQQPEQGRGRRSIE